MYEKRSFAMYVYSKAIDNCIDVPTLGCYKKFYRNDPAVTPAEIAALDEIIDEKIQILEGRGNEPLKIDR